MSTIRQRLAQLFKRMLFVRQSWGQANTADASSPTTILDQARQSGDLFKQAAYFDQAEPDMDALWGSLIWPLIQNMDFSCVVDLAAGHGRNSAKLLPHADLLIIVDINQECIDYCKARFADKERPRGIGNIRYLKNDGITLRGIPDSSVSLVYSFDSMVHFANEVIQEYLKDFYRVLKPGGHCFCHHSNYTGNPGGDFRQSPHWRNFMSKELFACFSVAAGLQVVEQKLVDWGSEPALDCITILRKPFASSPTAG